MVLEKGHTNYATVNKLINQGYSVDKAYGMDAGRYYCFKFDYDLQEFLLDVDILGSDTEAEAWERLILTLNKGDTKND